MKKIGKEIVDFVEKNFDDVGCDFAKEALKIHYGVEQPRNIRGISTKEEEKMLKEEGVQFLKIPMPTPTHKFIRLYKQNKSPFLKKGFGPLH